jgi:prepilin-type N-terminal cleavage/methylation domain-containing protein
MNRNSRRHGFTMIELLVILAILAFLLGMLVPAVQQVRRAASRTQSSNNLKQLALAMHSINDAYRKLPPVVGSFPVKNEKAGTLFFHILPFIEQANVYRQADGDVTKNATCGMIIPIFLNPMDKSAPPGNRYKGWLATTSYAANWMVFGHSDGGTASIPRSFPDGTSNTIVYAERYQMCNGNPCGWGYSSLYTWAPMYAFYSKGKFQNAPTQQQCNPELPQAIDSAGIHVAMGDGSVRLVSERVSSETWYNATDPADGNVLGQDWND